MLDCSHQITGFNCTLEIICPVDNSVGYIGRLDMGVRVSIQYLYYIISLTWLKTLLIGFCRSYCINCVFCLRLIG